MTKRLIALWILLIAQLVVAVFLWWPHQRGPLTGQPWLSFKADQVSSITLTAGGQQAGQHASSLTLAKKDSHWVLPDAHNFPADPNKVSRLLDAIAGLKGTLPVAVTKDAAKRFHVANNKFETHLLLKGGSQTLANVYIGNAAGANLVYLRRADQSAIETNNLAVRLLDTGIKSWRDKQLLHLTNSQVTQLVLPQVTLKHHGSSWQALESDGSTVALSASKTQALVNQLTQLNYIDAAPQQVASKPAFTARVKMANKVLTYAFIRKSVTTAGGKDAPHHKVTWFMTRSDLPWRFKVSADTINSLEKGSIADLRAKPAKPKTSQASNSKVPANSTPKKRVGK